MPILQPPAGSGAMSPQQLMQQLHQHSRGVAQALIKHMVPRRKAAATAAHAHAATTHVAAAAAPAGSLGAGVGRGGSGPVPLGASTAAGSRVGGVLMACMLDVRQQGLLTELYSDTAGLFGGTLSSGINHADNEPHVELQVQQQQQREALCNTVTGGESRLSQQQQQQGDEGMGGTRSVKGGGFGYAAGACDGVAGSAGGWAGVAKTAAPGLLCEADLAADLATDFSDCQPLFAVMASLLE